MQLQVQTCFKGKCNRMSCLSWTASFTDADWACQLPSLVKKYKAVWCITLADLLEDKKLILRDCGCLLKGKISLSAIGNQRRVNIKRMSILHCLLVCLAELGSVWIEKNFLFHVYWNLQVFFGSQYWSFTQVKFPLYLQVLINSLNYCFL